MLFLVACKKFLEKSVALLKFVTVVELINLLGHLLLKHLNELYDRLIGNKR